MIVPMLTIRNLSVRYGEQLAVKHLDLVVPKGQVCGLLGPNGAGKSSTVRTIVGLQRPAEGSVTIDGFDMVDQPVEAKRRFGYVPELPALYEALSVEEHLALVGALHDLSPAVISEWGGKYLELFRLADCRQRRISALSKGMRQKVMLSSAFLHQPPLVILDEPLSGLDANAVRTLRDLIRRLADQGTAFLYCSHLIDVVERICDRVMILDQGAVVADGPTAELCAKGHEGTLDSLFRQLTTGPDDEVAVAALIDRMAGRATGLHQATSGDPAARPAEADG